MENALLETAVGQGIWAILSIFLIFYILKAQQYNIEMVRKLLIR